MNYTKFVSAGLLALAAGAMGVPVAGAQQEEKQDDKVEQELQAALEDLKDENVDVRGSAALVLRDFAPKFTKEQVGQAMDALSAAREKESDEYCWRQMFDDAFSALKRRKAELEKKEEQKKK